MTLIKQYWGNKLVPYNPKNIYELGLQKDTISFLLNVGVIKNKVYEEISRFRFLDTPFRENINGINFVKIAENFFNPERGLYIKIGCDSLYTENDFCNSSFEQFILFETIKSKITASEPNVCDDAIKGYECAREIIEHFKKADPAAIKPYSFWCVELISYAINYFYDEEERFKEVLRRGNYACIEDIWFEVLINGFKTI